MKILFAGTPEFAAVSLRALLATPTCNVVGVLTQPDRPAGRGRHLTASPVKQVAEAAGIEVFQPERASSAESLQRLEALGADVMVVVAYGQILSAALIDMAPLGSINVHASLLPRWRGAAPIQRAIMAGDTETGVCIMQVVEALDAGPVIHCRQTAIGPDDTQGSLHDRLAELGAEALVEALQEASRSGAFVATEQDPAGVTYAHKIRATDLPLDWIRPAHLLDCQVRALSPRPGASTVIAGHELKVLATRVVDTADSGVPGTLTIERNSLHVACGEHALALLEVKPAGKQAMDIRAFINGYLPRTP